MQPAASDGLESDASRSKDFLMLLAPLLLRLMVFRLLHFAELPFFILFVVAAIMSENPL